MADDKKDDKGKSKDNDQGGITNAATQTVKRVTEFGRREIMQNLGIILALILLGGGVLGRFAAKILGASESQLDELSKVGVGDVDKEFATRLFGRGVNEETNYIGVLVELFKSIKDPSAELSLDQVNDFIKWLAKQDRYVQRQLLLVVAERFVDYLKLHVGEERTRQLLSRGGVKSSSTTTSSTPSQSTAPSATVAMCDPGETKEVLDAAAKHAVEILIMLAKRPDDIKPKILEIAGIKHKDTKIKHGPAQWAVDLRKKKEKELEQTRRRYGSREVR